MSFIGASRDAADTIISGYVAIGNAAGDDVSVITLICTPHNAADTIISGYVAIGNAAGGDASVIIQACTPRNSADIIISGYDTVGNAAGDNVGTRTNCSDNATDRCFFTMNDGIGQVEVLYCSAVNYSVEKSYINGCLVVNNYIADGVPCAIENARTRNDVRPVAFAFGKTM